MRQLLCVASTCAAVCTAQVEFPRTVFREDFSQYRPGEYPGTFEVVRNSIHPHLHGDVRDGCFRILYGGNFHVPKIEPLRDFEIAFRAHADALAEVAMVLIAFRADFRARRGYFLFYRWGKRYGATRCTLHLLGGTGGTFPNLAAPQPFDDVGDWHRLRLVVVGQHFRMYHNGVLQGEWRDAERRVPGPGRIALDAAGGMTFPGPKYIDDLVIRTPAHALRQPQP